MLITEVVESWTAEFLKGNPQSPETPLLHPITSPLKKSFIIPVRTNVNSGHYTTSRFLSYSSLFNMILGCL